MKKTSLSDKDIISYSEKLRSAIDLWTDEIDGSDYDVDKGDVGENHKPKRVLKPEFFQAGWLEQLVPPPKELIMQGRIDTTKKIVTPQKQGSNTPSLWWVAIDGKSNGPHEES